MLGYVWNYVNFCSEMAAALQYVESDWLLLKYSKSSESSCVYLPFNPLATEFFFQILAHPVFKNVNNTGTKQGSIMK
jgi:hypothetical protein